MVPSVRRRPRHADPAPLVNEIVAENRLPGAPAFEWDVSGSGDPSIQGFATDISVHRAAGGVGGGRGWGRP